MCVSGGGGGESGNYYVEMQNDMQNVGHLPCAEKIPARGEPTNWASTHNITKVHIPMNL